MSDLMALALPIEVPGGPQALAMFKQVEAVGKNTAFQYNASWTMASAQVQNTFRQVEKVGVESQNRVAAASRGSSAQYARAALQISGTLQAITAAGDVSAGQLTRLISLASGIAFQFGPTGQVVGALALTTVSIVNMFTRAREEMEKTARVFKDQIAKLRIAMSGSDSQDAVTAKQKEITAEETKRSELSVKIAAARLAKEQGERNALKLLNDLGKEADASDAALKRLNTEMAELNRLLVVFTQADDVRAGRDRDAAKVLEDRAAAVERLNAATREMMRLSNQPLSARIVGGGLRLPGAPGVGPLGSITPDTTLTNEQQAASDEAIREAATRAREEMLQLQDSLSATIASGISGAISQGFSAAIDSGSILEGIQSLGKSILAALGDIIRQMGEVALKAWVLAQSWNPFSPTGLAAALGLIALGSLLSGLGGAGGGGSSGGGGFRTFQDRQSTTTIGGSGTQTRPVATPVQPVTNHNTFIGVDDPRAQRQLKQMLRNADARGV